MKPFCKKVFRYNQERACDHVNNHILSKRSFLAKIIINCRWMITERGMSDPVLYGNWCLWNPNFRSKESLWLRWRITIIIMKSLWNLASNVGLPFMYLIQVKFSLCCVLFVLYFVVLSDFRELTNILFYSFLFLGTQCAEMK